MGGDGGEGGLKSQAGKKHIDHVIYWILLASSSSAHNRSKGGCTRVAAAAGRAASVCTDIVSGEDDDAVLIHVGPGLQRRSDVAYGIIHSRHHASIAPSAAPFRQVVEAISIGLRRLVGGVTVQKGHVQKERETCIVIADNVGRNTSVHLCRVNVVESEPVRFVGNSRAVV